MRQIVGRRLAYRCANGLAGRATLNLSRELFPQSRHAASDIFQLTGLQLIDDRRRRGLQGFARKWLRQKRSDGFEFFPFPFGINDPAIVIKLLDRLHTLSRHRFKQIDNRLIITSRAFAPAARDHIPIVHGTFDQAQGLGLNTIGVVRLCFAQCQIDPVTKCDLDGMIQLTHSISL